MIDLAKLKGAGAVNFRARYLAVHRRSEHTVRSLIDVGAGRGNSSPVCPRTSGRKVGHGSSAPALNTLLLKRKSIQGSDRGEQQTDVFVTLSRSFLALACMVFAQAAS